MNPSDFYDVIVAGGGFSGVAAAIAAAREGMSVLLIEKSNCLGGAAANCLVNPFMPYWTKINEKKVNLCQGIFLEICEELQKNDGIHKNGMEFDEEILKLVLNRMVLKAGVRLLFHSCLADAERDQEQIRSVTVLNKSGRQTYRAHCFIDATGDADLAALCGVPFRLGRDEDRLCQPMTLCFRIAGVDIDKRRHGFQKAQQLYKQWRKEGKIKNPREDILLFETLQDGVIHVNSTRIVKRNPVDAWDRTQAEIEAREQVFELFRFLKENAAGLKTAACFPPPWKSGCGKAAGSTGCTPSRPRISKPVPALRMRSPWATMILISTTHRVPEPAIICSRMRNIIPFPTVASCLWIHRTYW